MTDAPFEVDQPRIEAAVREILAAIGEDPERDGLQKTPARVARMYAEICGGLHRNPDEHLQTTFEAEHDEMVMVRDIPMYSLCEHHLAPFIGKAHVAYIPGNDGRVIGLSKFARIVDMYARRLQIQENLTKQIADAVLQVTGAKGVADFNWFIGCGVGALCYYALMKKHAAALPASALAAAS